MDSTENIARRFSNVHWYTHPFDTHAAQWRRAVVGTRISTEYVLALDADMQVPKNFVKELSDRFLTGRFTGGLVAFDYRVLGRSLSASLYPAQLRLFRREAVIIGQVGHTQLFEVDGMLYRFRARVVHDDRKALGQWLGAQERYSDLEAGRLEQCRSPRWKDRLRLLGLMPLVAGMGAYVIAGGPLRGAASLCYAWERVTYECLLALRLMRKRYIDDDC
jgi:hypothetical protein